MDKIMALLPERLRSRKLGFAAVLIYILTQLKQFGIEIDPELQAQLIAWVGGGYITIQGLIDLVEKAIKAWRSGGVAAAVKAVTKTETPNVDSTEG